MLHRSLPDFILMHNRAQLSHLTRSITQIRDGQAHRVMNVAVCDAITVVHAELKDVAAKNASMGTVHRYHSKFHDN